jgi:hypothetical protein
MELQGALFFGTGEKMLSDIAAALRRETSCIILDLRFGHEGMMGR